MDPGLKSTILKFFPRSFLKNFVPLNNLFVSSKASAARKSFVSSTKSNLWLDLTDLESIYNSGVYGQPEKYAYDPESTQKRGRERCAELLNAIPVSPEGKKTLEVGALDARASYYLVKSGAVTHALDLTDSHFTDKIIDAGVDCRVMSATDLKYDDASFDVVFSFNAFEHIDDPDKALSEAVRVTKPGGYIYLNFGPLWSSPFGAHGHESIPIPYIQYLWKQKLLLEFCKEKNIGTIEFHTMNQWPQGKFNDLWSKYSTVLDKVIYRERLDSHGCELIKKYPGCFKGKVGKFDELIINAIEVLFRKKK